MAQVEIISIEIVYGTPEQQTVIAIQCESSSTIHDAITQSGITQQFPEIKLEDDMVGIFGYRQALNHILEDQDRIEIYRPLHLSPTEARKIRAAKRRARRNQAI